MSETTTLTADEALARVIGQCEADIDYYGDSDDPMSIGRVIGVREVLHVIGRDHQ
jgi:hypothetical protein